MTEAKKIYITKAGLEKAQKEYEDLKALKTFKMQNDETPKIMESEDINPDYISFHEDIDLLETRLAELEGMLKNAVLVDPANADKNTVQLGARVYLEVNGQEHSVFTIVDSIDADPSAGMVPYDSPVGKALLGHKIGEEVIIDSPTKTKYKIKKINYDEA